MHRNRLVAWVAGVFGATSFGTIAYAVIRFGLRDSAVAFSIFALLPLLAAAACWLELRGRARLAGVLLILSCASLPPAGLYPINILVFAFGLAEVIAGPEKRIPASLLHGTL